MLVFKMKIIKELILSNYSLYLKTIIQEMMQIKMGNIYTITTMIKIIKKYMQHGFADPKIENKLVELI